ncbi:unnamed protein product [Paramecium pentaurelia]|uniref:Uncharacterized protein n=1 Tax=Paramecium pentaurelia TaxID=43138 RepID=A0A8S1UAE2_9CILI|nr:unnamed protein product [Paramecium pentaurelia]
MRIEQQHLINQPYPPLNQQSDIVQMLRPQFQLCQTAMNTIQEEAIPQIFGKMFFGIFRKPIGFMMQIETTILLLSHQLRLIRLFRPIMKIRKKIFNDQFLMIFTHKQHPNQRLPNKNSRSNCIKTSKSQMREKI